MPLSSKHSGKKTFGALFACFAPVGLSETEEHSAPSAAAEPRVHFSDDDTSVQPSSHSPLLDTDPIDLIPPREFSVDPELHLGPTNKQAPGAEDGAAPTKVDAIVAKLKAVQLDSKGSKDKKGDPLGKLAESEFSREGSWSLGHVSADSEVRSLMTMGVRPALEHLHGLRSAGLCHT